MTSEMCQKGPCKEALSDINEGGIKIDPIVPPMIQSTTMEYSKKTREELIALCKEKGIKGYSGKKKGDVIQLLTTATALTTLTTFSATSSTAAATATATATTATAATATTASTAATAAASNNDTYKVLSLFSGMGGMDVGFAEQVIVHRKSVKEPSYIDAIATAEATAEATVTDFVHLKRLPFEIVFQNDILPEAKKIAELNHWNHNFHLKDIRELLAESFDFPHADVITGGFPCQDFSHAGKRKGFDSTRGTLYQSYVELVKRVKPIVFVAENVNGLLTMPGEPIKQIIADFSQVGYDVTYQLIKCEEHGIPQTRWRVIIMGVRLDKRGRLSEDWNIIDENKIQCTIGHYFKHLQEPNATDDPAQQIYSKAARLKKGQGQKEVGLDEFAPTMRAEHHGNIEFRRITDGKNKEPNCIERRLSVREAALIQTFPPTCLLTDPKKPSSKAYKPIGNAVPPLLGYIIARKVQSILDAIQPLSPMPL